MEAKAYKDYNVTLEEASDLHRFNDDEGYPSHRSNTTASGVYRLDATVSDTVSDPHPAEFEGGDLGYNVSESDGDFQADEAVEVVPLPTSLNSTFYGGREVGDARGEGRTETNVSSEVGLSNSA
jgi:hypothetical protein